MHKTKVKASSAQLAMLRTEMILHPDMGLTNPILDKKWTNLKMKLDALGVIRTLEQWIKVNVV